MSYRVKELFGTLQGEGINAGRAAVFCRFAGCNLWSGREQHRASAVCKFCDTDFVGTDGPGGGVFDSADDLTSAACSIWTSATGAAPRSADGGAANRVRPLIVFTGGEPLLQLDEVLAAAVRSAGFEVAIETNGTIAVPSGVDWVCVSPKAGTEVVVRTGDELKLIYPQPGAEPERFDPAQWSFAHFVLQPMDGPELARNTADAVAYCRANPRWRLSLQTHKMLGIP